MKISCVSAYRVPVNQNQRAVFKGNEGPYYEDYLEFVEANGVDAWDGPVPSAHRPVDTRSPERRYYESLVESAGGDEKAVYDQFYKGEVIPPR